MIFKKIDLISPDITLYYKGFSSHSSIISGIIYFIALVIILIFSVYYVWVLFKRENPEAYFYNHFVEDAGEFPINSSSFFHFISLMDTRISGTDFGFDFESFRLIGIDTYLYNYSDEKNLTKIDHWLYGLCNEDSDIKGISHLITQEYYSKSACIRKYFNSSSQKYYDTNDENFRWPRMAHGTYSSEKEFYVVFMEKCDEETLNLTLGEGYSCRDDSEIGKYFNTGVMHFNFIDQYADVLNYEEPYNKYIYRIESKLSKESYAANHLNFNPTLIQTHNGLLIDNIEKNYSYIFERNEAITTSYTTELNFDFNFGPENNDSQNTNLNSDKKEIRSGSPEDQQRNNTNNNEFYMLYYLWLGNRMQDYIRTYRRIQDVMSDIGGIFQAMTLIAEILNYLYNSYIVLYDTQELISSYKISIKEKENKNEKFRNESEIGSNHCFSQISDIDKSINVDEKKDNINYIINNKVIDNQKVMIQNSSTSVNDTSIVDDNKSNNENNNIKKKVEKKNTQSFNFCSFLLKTICCKKNQNIKNCEKVRMNIISEENIFRNHIALRILLKQNKINIDDYLNTISLNDIIK